MLSRILLFVFVAFIASPALAIETIVKRCDGCTIIQKRSAAQSLPVASQANVYFMDFSSGLLSGFYVYRAAQPYQLPPKDDVENIANLDSATSSRANPATVGGQLWLESLSITPEQQLAFAEFVESYFDFVGYASQINSSIRMPHDSSFDSIYDIAGCPACARNWLLANAHRVSNTIDLFDILYAKGLEFRGSIGGDAGDISATYAPYLQFKLIMESDVGANGEAGYCMATLTGSGVIIDTNSCTDSDGNPIPVSAENFRNVSFLFLSQNNLERWLQRARLFGIPITGAGGNVTVGGMRRYDCNQAECVRDDDDESDPH